MAVSWTMSAVPVLLAGMCANPDPPNARTRDVSLLGTINEKVSNTHRLKCRSLTQRYLVIKCARMTVKQLWVKTSTCILILPPLGSQICFDKDINKNSRNRVGHATHNTSFFVF